MRAEFRLEAGFLDLIAPSAGTKTAPRKVVRRASTAQGSIVSAPPIAIACCMLIFPSS